MFAHTATGHLTNLAANLSSTVVPAGTPDVVKNSWEACKKHLLPLMGLSATQGDNVIFSLAVNVADDGASNFAFTAVSTNFVG